jgi:hypothetical protein
VFRPLNTVRLYALGAEPVEGRPTSGFDGLSPN